MLLRLRTKFNGGVDIAPSRHSDDFTTDPDSGVLLCQPNRFQRDVPWGSDEGEVVAPNGDILAGLSRSGFRI